MTTFILLRHGNTFAPGDRVVMVGSSEDLPLVETGLEQARKMAHALTGHRIEAVYTGPLQRTTMYAQILTQSLGLPPARVDNRLSELDYGTWSGLTDDEIHKKGDRLILQAWRERGVWPEGVFGDADSTVAERVSRFVAELSPQHPGPARVGVVTSQGILRYFLRCVPEAYAAAVRERRLGVSTGNGCILKIGEDGAQISLWNASPQALSDGLKT